MRGCREAGVIRSRATNPLRINVESVDGHRGGALRIKIDAQTVQVAVLGTAAVPAFEHERGILAEPGNANLRFWGRVFN